MRVRQLLDIKVLRDAEVVAGAEGIDNIVTGVTIMEAPDIADWLSGGELLLTSLYPIHSDAATQRELVVKLAQKKASALAIKVHRFVEEIPKVIIDTGNQLGLPIIQLSKDIRFVDIMYPVMGELFNKQVLKLNYYKEVHKRFTALALADEGLETIITSLQELICNPVAIYDKDFHCICSTDKNINEFNILERDLEYKGKDGNFLHYKRHVSFPNVEKKEAFQIVVPIQAVNQIKAYLTIAEVNKQLGPLDFIAIENAATVVCLEMVKQFAVAEVEQKFKNDLIDDLIKGKIDSVHTIYERANLIGWDLNTSHVVMLFYMNNLNEYLGQTKHKKDIFLRKFKSEVHSLVYNTVSCYVPNCIIRSGSDTILVLWPVDKTNHQDWLKITKKAAKKVQTRIKKEMRQISMTVGIGNIAKDIMTIAQSYQEAQDALEFGQLIYEKEAIISFAELGVFRLLCKFKDVSVLKDFIPQSLIKLLEYDQSNSGDLVETLEVFLKCNANASQASKQLFIHYKTVLYRLERIREITSIDLENNEERLEIQIGLKILRLLNSRK
ncbi:PucR family transcriptional regulator ligand-binding domain-containing protein [Clostridiaceae bacterium 35-E11]